MYQLINAVNEQIDAMKKAIEENDREIFNRVNSNNSMKVKISNLQYELNKLEALSQKNVPQSGLNSMAGNAGMCVTHKPNMDDCNSSNSRY